MLTCNLIRFAGARGIGNDTPIVNLIPVGAGKVGVHGGAWTGVGHAITFHVSVVPFFSRWMW